MGGNENTGPCCRADYVHVHKAKWDAEKAAERSRRGRTPKADIVEDVEGQAERIVDLEKSVERLGDRIAALEARPARRASCSPY